MGDKKRIESLNLFLLALNYAENGKGSRGILCSGHIEIHDPAYKTMRVGIDKIFLLGGDIGKHSITFDVFQ